MIMGFIKCEKVFAGSFTFSGLLNIKMKAFFTPNLVKLKKPFLIALKKFLYHPGVGR